MGNLLENALGVALLALGAYLFWRGFDFLGTLWGWNYRDSAPGVYIVVGGFWMLLGTALAAGGIVFLRSRHR